MLELFNVLIGTDTELFLTDQNGQFKSAVGLIGGEKGNPIDIGNCCGLEEDNVAVELTVPPVPIIGGLEEMWDNIQFVLKTIESKIPKDLKIECCPSALFDQKELSTDKAKEFGCEPDFNAWEDGRMNKKPKAKDKTLRSCGGHIHIGYPNADPDQNINLVKLLDLYLGVPFVLVDKDKRRRELYGKAGCFRNKHYGLEYRVLSNIWIKDKRLMEGVFDGVVIALEDFNAGVVLNDPLIAQCINTSDEELAMKIVNTYDIPINFVEILEFA
jgi:hypothetical protein